MLVSFSVSNFRSFAAEQTFSLVASRRLGVTHETHLLPIPGSDEKVLRTGVIYGANGAGKSNLLAALGYAKRIALEARGKSRGTGRKVFRLDDLQGQPSTFDLQFISKENLYRFGFSVDDERITEEWLVRVIGSKEHPIYERRTDHDGNVEVDAPGLQGASDKLTALVTVGGPQNQSFLATIRATLASQDCSTEINDVIEWIDGLTLVGPDSMHIELGDRLATEPNFRRFAGEFLKAASTGVDRIKAEKSQISSDEFHTLVPEDVLWKMLGSGRDEGGSFSVRLPNGHELLAERSKEGNHFYRIGVQAAHKHRTKKEALLELFEESDGTRRLLELLPALYRLKAASAVYFIDEIDRSMHPMLVYKFLEYFLNACNSTPCQIIVTTHESHLLNLDLLRRDEIWFAEKDPDGATHLYSLTDFNVRKDLQIQKGYLEGRFGAIPFLGEIDRLIESHD